MKKFVRFWLQGKRQCMWTNNGFFIKHKLFNSCSFFILCLYSSGVEQWFCTNSKIKEFQMNQRSGVRIPLEAWPHSSVAKHILDVDESPVRFWVGPFVDGAAVRFCLGPFFNYSVINKRFPK